MTVSSATPPGGIMLNQAARTVGTKWVAFFRTVLLFTEQISSMVQAGFTHHDRSSPISNRTQDSPGCLLDGAGAGYPFMVSALPLSPRLSFQLTVTLSPTVCLSERNTGQWICRCQSIERPQFNEACRNGKCTFAKDLRFILPCLRPNRFT